MSKSPKIRKKAPQRRAAKAGPGRKAAKTARRTATSGKAAAKSGRRADRPRGGAKPIVRTGTKQAVLMALLGSPQGASVPEMAAKAGWQPHSVRGFLSGTIKKKLGLALTSETVDGRGRVYRIAKRP